MDLHTDLGFRCLLHVFLVRGFGPIFVLIPLSLVVVFRSISSLYSVRMWCDNGMGRFVLFRVSMRPGPLFGISRLVIPPD
jgi:hypothetical protein